MSEKEKRKIKANPKIVSGSLLVGAGIFLLMLLIQQFFFDIKELLKISWWIIQLEKSVCIAIIFNGLIQIFYESRNKDEGYIRVRDNYGFRLIVVDRLANHRTKDALKKEVDSINKESIFEAKLEILSKVVDDIYCDDLVELTESFDNFNKNYNLNFWRKYFLKYEITKKQQKRIIKAIKKINKGDFYYEKISTNDILIDSEFKNKSTKKASAVKFSFSKMSRKATLYKMVVGLGVAALFSSIFVGQSIVSWQQILFTIIAHLFIFAWTVVTGVNEAFKIIAARKAALKNRSIIIDDAMVEAKIFDLFQKLLDKIYPPDKRLIQQESTSDNNEQAVPTNYET